MLAIEQKPCSTETSNETVAKAVRAQLRHKLASKFPATVESGGPFLVHAIETEHWSARLCAIQQCH